MSPQAPPGWSLRLVDLLGAPLHEVTEAHLERLVTGAVREDADLDFKQERYGNSDGAKRELAGDLAARANDRGGLLVIGIRDEDDVAVERTPVELVDGEEARIRQIAASNIAPHLTFDVRVVASEDDPTRGYYLVIVPPSSLRPHAVRKDRDLRYPRRDGTTTRWLSEPEVADLYRDRFSVASGQTGRLSEILDDGLGAMDLSDEAFLAVALVPTGPGSMPIDLARVDAVGEWVRKEIGAPLWFEGFFDRTGPVREPGVRPASSPRAAAARAAARYRVWAGTSGIGTRRMLSIGLSNQRLFGGCRPGRPAPLERTASSRSARRSGPRWSSESPPLRPTSRSTSAEIPTGRWSSRCAGTSTSAPPRSWPSD